MPTKKSATPTAPKVMDVAHPGTSKASPTSTPIIVSNRPILRDPMMVEQTPKPAEQPVVEAKKTPTKKLDLKPLDDSEAKTVDPPQVDASLDAGVPDLPIAHLDDMPAKPAVEESVEAPAEPSDEPTEEPANATAPEADDKPKADVPEPPAEAPATPSPAAESTESSEEAAPEEPSSDDLLEGEAKSTDSPEAKAAREAAEKQLALEKLVAEGTYLLPINDVQKRHKHELILGVILIVLVLVIVGCIAALDAGLLHVNGLTPPTNFIKN